MSAYRMSRVVVHLITLLAAALLVACTGLPVEPLPSPTPTAPKPTAVPPTVPAPTAVPTSALPMGVLQDPAGFAAAEGTSGHLVLRTAAGEIVTELDAPGLGFGPESTLHIAGGLLSAANPARVVYFDGQQGSLVLVDAGKVSTLASSVQVFAVAGAPGQPAVAYSAIQYQDNALISRLYAGTLETLPGIAPALTITSTESWYVFPLAVHAQAGKPLGVWYSYAPYGIGGDIVFLQHNGLYYLDLATGHSEEVLKRDAMPSSLSGDFAWLAYATGIMGPLTIRDLRSGQETTFPLLPDSDRGAGYAVFSPDNQHVAWMEAGGSRADQPTTFHTTIRIATTTGTIVAEIPLAAFGGTSGSGAESAIPVGWLDRQTLLVQVQLLPKEEPVVMRVGLSGGVPILLAPGHFAELLYP